MLYYYYTAEIANPFQPLGVITLQNNDSAKGDSSVVQGWFRSLKIEMTTMKEEMKDALHEVKERVLVLESGTFNVEGQTCSEH